MSSRTAWAVLALSLVGGCLDHTPLGPGANVVVVHAVLNPTTSVQHVSVRHSGSELAGGVPVHGATVTLTAPDGTVQAASESATSSAGPNVDARYDVAMGSLTVGQPYHLRVVTADGMVAEGDAIVPAAPPPRTLAERRFDRTRDTLRLVWPRATGARAYEVRVLTQRDSTGRGYVDTPNGRVYLPPGDFVTYVDTSVAINGTVRRNDVPVFLPGVRYDVIVSAVDDHYYNYFAHDSDPYTPTALPSSLRGGVGVFGAIVPILRQSIVVEGSFPAP